MGSKRIRIVATGRVQGVYYRATARELAGQLGLAGWARNLDDGRVEVVFEGAESTVTKAVEWCREGSLNADVESVDIVEETPEGLTGFEVVSNRDADTRSPRTRVLGKLRQGLRTRGSNVGRSLVTAAIDRLPAPYDRRVNERLRHLKRGWDTASESSLSRPRHLYVYWRGFDEELYHLYGLDERSQWRDFLSEYARQCTRGVNNRPDLLDDKELFYNYFHVWGLSEFLPGLLGYVDGGRDADGDGFVSRDEQSFERTVQRAGRVVVKPVRGGGGTGVHVYEHDGTRVVDRETGEPVDLERPVGGAARAIVTEFCQQASYVDEIYPDAANTIRVYAMKPERGEPFLASAIHRIGTELSAPLDNFSQGGLAAAVDPETGVLSAAARRVGGRLEWCESHPETGAQIAGTGVPNWPRISAALCRLMAEQDGIDYAGWDVLVTGPGEFQILEGNSFPNVRVSQLFDPLLVDDRTRQFYRDNRVPV